MKNIILAILITVFTTLAANAQSDIRRVDFKNFTFEPFCASDETEKVTVKDGEFYREKQMEDYTDRFYFKVFSFAYGDLTGDGKDEAVILSVCNMGGTGNFSEGFIYEMKNGKPALVGRIPGGDRAYGGLREARVENGILAVEVNDAGENGASCCPEFVVTEKYKLSGGKLVEIAKSDRRELYPKERVSFPKGSSGTTFKTMIPAGEIKRYVVGARAGQTLTVSVSSKDVSLRLLEDVEVTEGINNFLARLPKNGDYAIELQSSAETDLEITVNVKIK
jgi:hypothetical protein